MTLTTYVKIKIIGEDLPNMVYLIHKILKKTFLNIFEKYFNFYKKSEKFSKIIKLYKTSESFYMYRYFKKLYKKILKKIFVWLKKILVISYKIFKNSSYFKFIKISKEWDHLKPDIKDVDCESQACCVNQWLAFCILYRFLTRIYKRCFN